MLQRMRESLLSQTLQVRVANDTQKIQPSVMTLCNSPPVIGPQKRKFRWSDIQVVNQLSIDR